MTIEAFEIKSRWTDAVIFTAQIDCAPVTPSSIKLGLAVEAGIKSGADLRGAYLRGANLGGAYLGEADLDFEIATPEQAAPRIAEVAKAALADERALNMLDWHTCETTHCIAGWAIQLAGDQGKALEDKFGPHIAGLSLLGTEAASHFYDNVEDATAWLKTRLETTA